MERTLIRPFWIAGAFLMMMDGLTTYLALTYVEGAQEGNPWMVWVITHLGLATMCILKGIVGVYMVYRLAVVAERGHRFNWMNRLRITFWRPANLDKVRKHAAWMLAFTVTLMGVVVGNNINAILGG